MYCNQMYCPGYGIVKCKWYATEENKQNKRWLWFFLLFQIFAVCCSLSGLGSLFNKVEPYEIASIWHFGTYKSSSVLWFSLLIHSFSSGYIYCRVSWVWTPAVQSKCHFFVGMIIVCE
jgi:hypothetical protein